jgi:RpiR family transcriptional regulator, carbohydrate utilization regulator
MSINTTHTGVLNTIRHEQGKLNPALKRIAKHILKHPEEVKNQSIKDLAEICSVSESTITRFVRAIDVASYQHLKIGIAEALSSSAYVAPEEEDACVYDDISTADSNEQIIKKIRFRSISAIDSTAANLDPKILEKAAKAIDASDTIAFFAMGSSCLAAENAVMRFIRVGKPCLFYRDNSVQQISATTLKKGSAAIAISDSGRTIMVVESLKKARLAGATTIAITSVPDSPLAKQADIVLLAATTKAPVGPLLYHESMTSKIAQLLITDALYSCYAIKHANASIKKLQETSTILEDSRYK